MSDKKHNGWTNYATWRINLEFFDACAPPDGEMVSAEELKEVLFEHIDNNVSDIYIAGWARAFCEDVNFHEIADALNESYVD